MTTRIYKVTSKVEGVKPRLIRATHPSNALSYVANSQFTVAVAKPDDLVELLKVAARASASRTKTQPACSPAAKSRPTPDHQPPRGKSRERSIEGMSAIVPGCAGAVTYT
jgi:hypothetical protein